MFLTKLDIWSAKHIFSIQFVLQMVVSFPVQIANGCVYTIQVNHAIKGLIDAKLAFQHCFHGKWYAVIEDWCGGSAPWLCLLSRVPVGACRWSQHSPLGFLNQGMSSSSLSRGVSGSHRVMLTPECHRRRRWWQRCSGVWLSFRPPAYHANDYRTEATSNQVRILSLWRRGIHRQPAYVISTSYNQISSTLDVMQRAIKILSMKLHTNFYFWKHITLRVLKKSTSGELQSIIDVPF